MMLASGTIISGEVIPEFEPMVVAVHRMEGEAAPPGLQTEEQIHPLTPRCLATGCVSRNASHSTRSFQMWEISLPGMCFHPQDR